MRRFGSALLKGLVGAVVVALILFVLSVLVGALLVEGDALFH